MTLSARLTEADASVAITPILIVDDSRAQRNLLRRTLMKWGYDVVEADSGEQALERCKSAHFDVIISDWMMPGISGVELCRTLRQSETRPTYFVLLTAQTESEILAEGLESGADDFLSKPFQAVELRARLRAGERVIQAQQALSAKNAALATALDELSNTYDAMERDLRGARHFQEGLLPARYVDLGAADVSLLFRACGHVGGDLVGYFPVNEDEVVVYSVDVSGHGVASALMTARVASYLNDGAPDRNIALQQTGDFYSLHPLPAICERLNNILQSDVDSDQYLTMILVHVNLSSGRVEVCSAGHPSAAHQLGSGEINFVELWSTPIGLVDEGEYATACFQLSRGDRLVLYSDGITECPNKDGVLLDETGLERILVEQSHLGGEAYTDALMNALNAFRGNESFPDDISAAVIHWK